MVTANFRSQEEIIFAWMRSTMLQYVWSTMESDYFLQSPLQTLLFHFFFVIKIYQQFQALSAKALSFCNILIAIRIFIATLITLFSLKYFLSWQILLF